MTRDELESLTWEVLTTAMPPDLKLATIMAAADLYAGCSTENRKQGVTSENTCSTRNQDVHHVRDTPGPAGPAHLRAVP